jgi:hypothetical protein
MSEWKLEVDGPHSRIYRLEKRGTDLIRKEPTAFLEYGVLYREAYWTALFHEGWSLNRHGQLQGIDRGDPLTPENLPVNWKTQMYRLLMELGNRNCCHRDIRPANLLVKQGRLCLIDFQWATNVSEEVPGEWPERLGGAYKCPDGYDDHWSLHKSLSEVAQGVCG